MRKMGQAEFDRRVLEVGYVEACVESARRDGGVFDEAIIREQASLAMGLFEAYKSNNAKHNSEDMSDA